jgi:hypothetical protein
VVWLVGSVCVGLLGDNSSSGEPTRPWGGSPAPYASLFSEFAQRPSGGPLAGIGLPARQPLLTIPAPRIPPAMLCLLSIPDVDPADRRAVRTAVDRFLCGVDNNDAESAFAGPIPPGATQRARFAELASHGPYAKTTITGTDTGPAGRRRATVVFQATSAAGGRPGCWRSRLTLADSGDGVMGLTAPVAVRCG